MIALGLILLGLVCYFSFKAVQMQARKDDYWKNRK